MRWSSCWRCRRPVTDWWFDWYEGIDLPLVPPQCLCGSDGRSLFWPCPQIRFPPVGTKHPSLRALQPGIKYPFTATWARPLWDRPDQCSLLSIAAVSSCFTLCAKQKRTTRASKNDRLGSFALKHLWPQSISRHCEQHSLSKESVVTLKNGGVTSTSRVTLRKAVEPGRNRSFNHTVNLRVPSTASVFH